MSQLDALGFSVLNQWLLKFLFISQPLIGVISQAPESLLKVQFRIWVGTWVKTLFLEFLLLAPFSLVTYITNYHCISKRHISVFNTRLFHMLSKYCALCLDFNSSCSSCGIVSSQKARLKLTLNGFPFLEFQSVSCPVP